MCAFLLLHLQNRDHSCKCGEELCQVMLEYYFPVSSLSLVLSAASPSAAKWSWMYRMVSVAALASSLVTYNEKVHIYSVSNNKTTPYTRKKLEKLMQ